MHRHYESLPKIKGVPDLVRKEAASAFIAITVLGLIASVADAPMQGSAYLLGIPSADIRAPWIFVGIQQMLRWFPATLAGIVVPGCALLILAFLPIIPPQPKLRSAIFFVILAATFVLTVRGYFV
jgi:quinol-cytochrome oxidoreductase complex cytochrome b subunit